MKTKSTIHSKQQSSTHWVFPCSKEKKSKRKYQNHCNGAAMVCKPVLWTRALQVHVWSRSSRAHSRACPAVMARDMAPLRVRSCTSLPGAIVSEMQTSLSLQPYNLCYNPFSTATWNSQIKDIVCIPRANRIGEKQFSSWIQFLPACLPFKLWGSPKSIDKPLGQLDWKLTWSNFRKLIPPVVTALLSHSTSASGNKWFLWVILAKLGEIVLNFLHNFSVPNCINSWR